MLGDRGPGHQGGGRGLQGGQHHLIMKPRGRLVCDIFVNSSLNVNAILMQSSSRVSQGSLSSLLAVSKQSLSSLLAVS